MFWNKYRTRNLSVGFLLLLTVMISKIWEKKRVIQEISVMFIKGPIVSCWLIGWFYCDRPTFLAHKSITSDWSKVYSASKPANHITEIWVWTQKKITLREVTLFSYEYSQIVVCIFAIWSSRRCQIEVWHKLYNNKASCWSS